MRIWKKKERRQNQTRLMSPDGMCPDEIHRSYAHGEWSEYLSLWCLAAISSESFIFVSRAWVRGFQFITERLLSSFSFHEEKNMYICCFKIISTEGAVTLRTLILQGYRQNSQWPDDKIPQEYHQKGQWPAGLKSPKNITKRRSYLQD